MKNVSCIRWLLVGVMAAVTSSTVFAQGPAPSLVKDLVASWQRASTDIIDIAEAMPEERYDFQPVPEVSTFSDQLVHVAGIVQRFIDSAKGTKRESAQPHKTMTKAEVISLLKETFQTGQEMIGSLTDTQLAESVKYPIGDRTVTRLGFWLGPMYQIRNHHGQLVVYLRMNGVVPPTTARRAR